MSIPDRVRTIVKKELSNLPAHGFDHLERTAAGACWLAKESGFTKSVQENAYIAGLLHDIVRPPTEKIDHTVDSLNAAKQILAKIGIGETRQKCIIGMISAHRAGGSGDIADQAVFLSDKIFEQSGAYICFRRCMFLGESSDYKNLPLRNAVIAQSGARMKRFKPSVFPETVRKIAAYQYDWQEIFVKAFAENEEWAAGIANRSFLLGKSGNTSITDVIRNYDPKFAEDRKFRDEAVRYIDGKLFGKFRGMLGILK